MKSKHKHKGLIFFIVNTFIFLSFIASFAGTTTYQYDDVNRVIRVERGTRGIGGDGTVIQQVTLDGNPWEGTNRTLTYQCSILNSDGSEDWGPVQTATTLPVIAANRPPGTRYCEYRAGGPAGATFYGVAPTATQTLTAGGTITFTYAFFS